MLGIIVALAAASPSVIDAERAFAQMAQDQGQWTAFRATADPQAVMFLPGPVKAHEWLKDRRDPPISVRWQPTAAWISCDGYVAVTTGNWQRPDGSVGYFTTLWHIDDPDHPVWHWSIDHGDALAIARTAITEPKIARANCSRPRGTANWPANPVRDLPGNGTIGGGSAGDNTLLWRWYVAPDKRRGLLIQLWNGKSYDLVVHDVVGPPK